MRKNLLIVTFLHLAICGASGGAANLGAEDAFVYPLAVAVESGEDVSGDVLFVADLELPGVWKVANDSKQIYVRGSSQFRQPLNRPRCIALHPSGGILVGDSATREVYHVAESDALPQPLSGGSIGVPMALAVSPDGQTIFIADAENRALVKLPIEGGKPTWVARINARGLTFRDATTLVALVPGEAAIQILDVSKPPQDSPAKVVDDPADKTLLSERTFRFPAGMALHADQFYVTDAHEPAIYRISQSGKPDRLFSGEPLEGPVGIAAGDNAVWVADPRSRALVAIDADGKVLQVR